MSEQLLLKWNDQMTNMLEMFENLLTTETFVDVTLACDGRSLKAHKIVLSACSPYFMSLFSENPCKHPIVIMKDMRYCDLKAIIEFMYKGKVIVSRDDLPAFVKIAETLKVKRLNGITGLYEKAFGIVQHEIIQQNESTPIPTPVFTLAQSTDTPPLRKRRSAEKKRGRPRKRSKRYSKRSNDGGVPPKIKETNFDIAGLSDDAPLDATDDDNRSIGDQISNNSESQVPLHSSSTLNTSSEYYQPTFRDLRAEQPASSDENEFQDEPSKLLQQTFTTQNVPTKSQNSVEPITLPSVNDLEVPRSSMRSADSGSKAFVPVSIPLDSLGFNLQGPDSPQDVQARISSIEDPLMSSVPGTSHRSDASLLLSSAVSVPGQSNFPNNSIILPQDPQPHLTNCATAPRRSRRLNLSPGRRRP